MFSRNACSGYGYVCFMAHQVVQRRHSKAAVYALCGLDGRDLHRPQPQQPCPRPCRLAMPEQTEGLVGHCAPLEDYYLKTRYPNQWPGYTDIPFDHYSKVQADAAKEHAEEALKIVRDIMPPMEVEED